MLPHIARKIAGTAVAAASLFAVSGAQAAPVISCGNAVLGIRVTTIDPGLTGGLCYAQNGNIDSDFTNGGGGVKLFNAGGTSLQLLGKEITTNGDVASSLIDYTITPNTNGGQGTWTVAEPAWTTWQHLYLGFHFGGGGDTNLDNPDSFIIELARTDNFGSWELTDLSPTLTAQINGLSNVYLFGKDKCEGTTACDPVRPPDQVPEPGTLALAGLALLGAAATRRRKV